MRIVWGGPWNRHSATAAFGLQVVEELTARGHAVDVVRTEVGASVNAPALPAPGPVRLWGEVSIHELRRRTDAVILNFGDHYGSFGGMLDNFAEIGATGIFHDRSLARLAADWCAVSPDPYLKLRCMVDAAYGPDAWSEGEPLLTDLDAATRNHSMLEWFAAGVCGAVVHGEAEAQAARGSCPGPVAVIPIALQFAGLPPPPPRPRATPRLTVAAIAGANSAARVDAVVLALASEAQLRDRVGLRLIGEIDPLDRSRLEHLAASSGVRALEFAGPLPDEALRDRLSDVDVMACLDAPSPESGSASLLFALQSGRPTLVLGPAGETRVPGDLVLGCRHDTEVPDLARHLLWALYNPDAAHGLGERARKYACEKHTASSYVDTLIPLVELAVANRPRMLTGQALGRTLASFGLGPDDPSAARVGKVLSDMFGSPRDGR